MKCSIGYRVDVSMNSTNYRQFQRFFWGAHWLQKFWKNSQKCIFCYKWPWIFSEFLATLLRFDLQLALILTWWCLAHLRFRFRIQTFCFVNQWNSSSLNFEFSTVFPINIYAKSHLIILNVHHQGLDYGFRYLEKNCIQSELNNTFI